MPDISNLQSLVRQVWKVNYDNEEAEPDPEDLPPKAADEIEEEPANEEDEDKPVEEVVYDSADDEGEWTQGKNRLRVLQLFLMGYLLLPVYL